MKRERELEKRLRSLHMLGEAVTAMKSLAAHHLREARTALAPARVYRQGFDHLLESTGASLPAGDGPGGLLVIGADLGLCGGYNARLVAAAAEYREKAKKGPTFCVGRRTAALLRRRGVEIDRAYAAPTSVHGITDTLLALAHDMLGDYLAERMCFFDVVSSRFAGVGTHTPTATRLLPVEMRPSGSAAAVRYVDRERLAGVAVRELLYITIHDLLLDALASEHGARLAATQSAEDWLDVRTERLRRHLAAAHREASTQEVIEIAGGARARGRAH